MKIRMEGYGEEVVGAGESVDGAEKVLVMVHGRGDSASSFIRLAEMLEVSGVAFLAPQAVQHTWYPHSFLVPLSQNEPHLSRSLSGLSKLLDNVQGLGFESKDIYFLGFSQGACLTLEFCARNAGSYGGIIAFTGGLLGDVVDTSNYKGDFQATNIFIGSSDHDPHVPERRIDESAVILQNMGAVVTKKIYQGMGHTINQDEINIAREILSGTFKPVIK